ncbi:IS3 family transposase [sediment metagenome]|uniref:IS3 family transposase n=1 Tax=sediment metagenome TaxID=749907 RepID=D9PGP7_9ZZZZ
MGDAYDNAMAESFFASLECELLDRRCFRTQAEARMAVFRYLEGWYNPRRRHSALGYLSPMNFEAKHAATVTWPTLAVAGLGDHPTVVGPPGLHSAAPQRKLLTPSGEGRENTTVPQFLPVH